MRNAATTSYSVITDRRGAAAEDTSAWPSKMPVNGHDAAVSGSARGRGDVHAALVGD